MKLNMELPYDPAVILLCIYPKEIKLPSHKDVCLPICIAVLLTTGKIRKQ
jgi:hypothetical protein